MSLKLPLVWAGSSLLDCEGKAISPVAIVERLSLYDDLVRAVEMLNHYRPQDMPAIAVADVELTLLRARGLANKHP